MCSAKMSTCVAPAQRLKNMARIIENETGARRLIRLSTDDILSVVKDYQRVVPRFSSYEDARDFLADTVIYIPEEVLRT